MNRRDVIAVGAALVAVSGPAQAQTTHADHHDSAAINQLFDTASNCVKTGLVCIDHCLQAFAAGDSSLAACARAVDQMLSMCGTLAKLASLKSSYLPAMAKVALVVCQDCETECRKHADKHAPCKACAEACAACAAECKRTAA
jgi:Cys-rich four helix bundle protein (predicted Tat secretion target)